MEETQKKSQKELNSKWETKFASTVKDLKQQISETESNNESKMLEAETKFQTKKKVRGNGFAYLLQHGKCVSAVYTECLNQMFVC